MEEIKILELFAGIGACSKAFENLGIPHKIVDAVEIDKYAMASFNAIHNTNFEPQDIKKWNKNIEVDFILHGSPCTDFSLAGLQLGGDEGSGTRSSLMYESLRIIKKLNPKYVVWENVKNLISDKHVHNFNKYLNAMDLMGYESVYKVMNAKDYGIPQNRERIFTVSIRRDLNKHFVFPLEKPLALKLKDMLEDQVDEKYYLSNKALNGVLNTSFYQSSLEGRTETKDGCMPTLAARDYKDPKLVVEDHKPNKVDETLKIKNATAQGYLDARDGDGVDISSRMQFHRGNVQPGMSHTITTSGGNDRGVVVGDNKLEIDEPGTAIQKSGDWGSNNYSKSDTSYTICVNPKSDREQMVVVEDKVNVVGNYSPSGHSASRVVDTDGIAPTVMENHGTVTAIAEDDQYYVSDKGVKFILDPKRGMCTDVNADVAQTLTAKGQQNWTGSFVSPDIDYIEKDNTIGSTTPTVIHLKNGDTITSDDL